MKLSEAIRLGAMLRPQQAFYVQFDEGENATCALGAAAEAAGILDLSVPNGYSGKAPEAWRPLVMTRSACPACGLRATRVDNQIIHLNNYHRWTREQIADWVETIEAKAEQPANVLAEAVA
jgi:hypothetical protein